MTVTDALQQPGVLSGGYCCLEQTAGKVPGTTTATNLLKWDLLDLESLVPSDDPDIIAFPVMRKSRNSTQTTRAGIHKVMMQCSMPFYAMQGMQLWTALVGFDTIVASDTTVVYSGTVAAGTTILATSTLKPTGTVAPPSGVTSWRGAWMKLGLTATPTSWEYVQILDVDTAGTTITTTPFTGTYASASSDQIKIAAQHIIQENQAVGTKSNYLSVSFVADFAELYRWTMPNGFVQKGGIKGDTKTIKADFNLGFQQLPIQELQSTLAGVPFTSPGQISPAATELTDSPWIMFDGGLITPFYATSAKMMHNRITSLSWDLDNAPLTRQYGGGVQLAEVYVPGTRKQTITWREDYGQQATSGAALQANMYTDFVKTQASLPAFLSFKNAGVVGMLFGAYFPNCKIHSYKPVVAMNDVVGWDGNLEPLEDATEGISVRICVVNPVTTAYAGVQA